MAAKAPVPGLALSRAQGRADRQTRACGQRRQVARSVGRGVAIARFALGETGETAPLDKAVAAFYIYASVASGDFSDTVRRRTLLRAVVVFVGRGRNFRLWVRAC